MSQPHLDLDRLADLLAGEGSPADAAHVGQCEGCAGRLDELARADRAVGAALAAVPDPPMPAGLSDRLSAALAAEPPPATGQRPAWQSPPGPGGSPADGRERSTGPADAALSRTVTPFPAQRPSRIPFAAAAALLVAAGALAGGLLLTGRDGDTTSSLEAGGGSGGDAYADLATSRTGQDYAQPGTLAASLPTLLEGGATAGQPAGEDADAAQPAPAPAGEGSTGLSSAQAESRTAAGADPLERLRDPAELASCLSAVLPPEGGLRPLAVDYAAYAGQPALVIVLPAQTAPDKVDVFVVGAQCREGDDRTLFFTRLDRPQQR